MTKQEKALVRQVMALAVSRADLALKAASMTTDTLKQERCLGGASAYATAALAIATALGLETERNAIDYHFVDRLPKGWHR